MKFLATLLLALLPLLSPASPELEQMLTRLDETLARRQASIDNREQRIEAIRNILRKSQFSPEQQYVLNQQLIDEYTSFQADSAIIYYNKNLRLSQQLGNPRQLDDNLIAIGYFYSATGLYLEANYILASIDTTRLDHDQLIQYYIARHKQHNELKLYTHDVAQATRSRRLTEFYIRQIVANTDSDTPTRLTYELEQAFSRNDFAAADSISLRLTEMLPPLSREFAIAAYNRAIALGLEGRNEEQQIWFTRSALLDIELAISDNAALNSLANSLADTDISRAMRYMRVVMDDARQFNSRLRPWQDALVLSTIDKAYAEHKRRLDSIYFVFVIFLVLVAVSAGVVLVYMLRQNRRLTAARHELQEAYDHQNSTNNDLKRFNEQLLALNNQISETNSVKEEYIGIFLMMCSEYIDRMTNQRRHVRRLLRDARIDELRKEYASTDADEKELREFYTMFDTTFLRLYPTFIEEFNSLLNEDARIEIRKGEYLTTELRIFALIRLGINDSSKIAALLHYSLSTIYNYRSKIKTLSSISRDEFEERIKTIGSFNPQN